MSALPIIKFFRDIDKSDVPLVGGKCANIGEMTQAGFPVPGGFAITINAYDIFLRENKIVDKIYDLLSTVDVNDPAQLGSAATKIQKMVTKGEFPEDLAHEIINSYKKLSGHFRQALVAVRTSATAEDMPEASFAGMGTTLLNVKGEANLLNAVRECWASLFTGRSIFYRVENKIPHEKVKISVGVMEMVESEVSGVMFSIDPVKNDKDRIVIESVWGLGELIVQGSVVPDRYVVQKGTFAILSKEISDQSVQLIRTGGGENKEIQVPKGIRDKQKITDKEIIELAHYADKLQKHYYFPQDAEWAKEKAGLRRQGRLFIVQTRPVTVIPATSRKLEAKEVKGEIKISQVPILSGSAASPGIGTGPVKVLESPKEIGKIRNGDILVAPMTSPDYVPAMKKSVAVVTNEGGQTSHAAIVSRELGIPCVVGTKNATQKLKDGQIVTVNGDTGQIFIGSAIKTMKSKEPETKVEIKNKNIKTATKVYVNLAETQRANEVSRLNVDGVGLLRAEFMIANIGIHPKEAIKRKEQGAFIEKLVHDLEIFCRNFYPRPVVYRATDFKTNEYRSLPGGKFWEPIEPNPLLGFRGAFRYINDSEVFNLELQAIKKVRDKYDNLHLMIPFVRSPQELAKVRRLVAVEGLFEKPSFKFWMMVEIPVNVIQIEDFIKVGIDGVSIGSNDLTMLIEGTDRDNSEVARDFDERTPAVFWALRRVVRKCAEAGVTSSICGQAVSEYDDLVKKLVRWGVTSVSVNPDAIDRVRGVIAEAEKEI
jgi:pyruvate,water dikinase